MKILKQLGIVCMAIMVFYGCNESTLENANITMTDSGTLTLQLLDEEDAPISEVEFSVMDLEILDYTGTSSLSIKEMSIASGTTDEKGNIDFGSLNSGLYYVFGEYTDADNYIYQMYQFVQIVSGETKNSSINLNDYIGSLSLSVQLWEYISGGYSTVALDTANIMLIPYNSESSILDLPFNTLKALSIPLGKTDEEGLISGSNIPLGYYYIVAYYNEYQYDFLSDDYYSYTVFGVDESSENISVAYAEADEISISIPSETNFFVYYLKYNEETGKSDSVGLANSYLLFSNTSTSYFASAIDYYDFLVQTNEEGKCSFEIASDFSNSSYYLWIYTYNGTYTSYKVGSISTNDLKNNSIKIEVPASTFSQDYGTVNVLAKAKYINDLSFDTVLLYNTNLMLTTSTSSYFPGESSGVSVLTNDEGEAVFNNIKVGTYYLWAYTSSNYAQRSYDIIEVKKDETIELMPVFDASEVKALKADLNIDFYAVKNGSNVSISDAYVIISRSSIYSVEDALSYAYKSGKTNSDGKIDFTDLDLDDTYYLIIYYDRDTYYRTTLSKLEYNSDNQMSIAVTSNMVKN